MDILDDKPDLKFGRMSKEEIIYQQFLYTTNRYVYPDHWFSNFGMCWNHAKVC